MKSSFMNRIVSVLLVMVMILSMLTISLTGTNAASVDKAQTSGLGSSIGGALLERGKRVMCSLCLKANEAAYGKTTETADFFCKTYLMDAAEATAYDTKKLCQEILSELTVIENMITDYTVNISQQIAGTVAGEKYNDYTARWQSDVTDVIKNNGMQNVYNNYNKYYLISYVKGSGFPDTSTEKGKTQMDNINTLWKKITGKSTMTESDISDESYEAAEMAFLDAVFEVFNTHADPTKPDDAKSVYTGVKVNDAFEKTINELKNNFVYSGSGYLDSQLSCVESAATYAYYALPFAHEQHSFISSVMDQQVAVTMALQMAYGEYLAYQGKYLEDNHISLDSTITIEDNIPVTYNTLRQEYVELTENIMNATKDLCDADITVVTQNGGATELLTRKLSSYMPVQDAVLVDMSPETFYDSYDYTNNLESRDMDTKSIQNGTEKTYSKYFENPIGFYRVMSGGKEQTVYYVLDSHDISDEGNCIGMIDHKIDRKAKGDVHLMSADYKNLAGSFYDGANYYGVPNNRDVDPSSTTFDETSKSDGGVYKDLFNTPAFAFASYKPAQLLSRYIPAKKSGDTYMLTGSTVEHYGDDGVGTFYAEVMLVNGSQGDTSSTITMEKKSLSDLQFSEDGYNHSMTAVLTNSAEDYIYMQNAGLVVDDKGETIEDFYIVNKGDCIDGSINESESDGATIGNDGKIKSGNNITVRFKLSRDTYFSSLKAVRNNGTKTETILIDSYDELKSFEKKSDGYYEFNFTMPYSDTTFVLTTERTLDEDDQGRFVIRDYDDLCFVAENVNSGLRKYVNGSYILANDITVEQDQMWTSPIGQYPNFFKGEFDGQGYTISGLNFEGTTENNYFGLFGIATESTIKNLNLKDVDFDIHCAEDYDATKKIGGLCAASSYKSEIKNCTVSGNITVTSDNSCQPKSVGGICGINESDIAMEKCINYCNIDANAVDVGGICGYATNTAEIVNCANFGNLKAYQKNPSGILKQPENCGGIIGETQGNAKAVNCYNVGVISGDSNNSSIVSLSVGDRPENCYYLDTCAQDEYATSKTLEQFKSGEVAHLLNKNVAIPAWAWFQNLDNGKTPDEYPTLNFTRDNVVFKVDREDRTYSNIPNDYLIGDADLDGKVTIMDATIIQMHCAQLYELTGVALVNADTTRDNSISISDATKVQGYIAGIIKEL